MNKLAIEVPLNQVSFGQLGCLILRTLFDREKAGTLNLDLYLFPVGGNIDLSSQKLPEDFKKWIQDKFRHGLEDYTRDINVFKLWHLNGSNSSLTNKKQTLLSFYELDSPTKVELNIAKNNNLCFTSKYTCEIFKQFGVNTYYLPLGFDSYNFSKLEKKFHTDGRLVTNLTGKWEKRKGTAKAIKSWIKAFANDRRYFLQCAIFNPFLNEQQNNDFIKSIVGNEKPFNVGFFPIMKENYIYNDFLNSANIIIGMGNESWGLPEFQSVALGKYGVILNANGYKSWVNEENSILVQPSGKEDVTDNIFFRKNDMFNVGNIFTWNEDEFIEGCKLAHFKAESNPINVNGIKLQQTFNKEKFLDNILSLSGNQCNE